MLEYVKPMFNADDYKNVNREQWQATAQAWHDWMPHVTRWLRGATDTMLEMAEVGPGDRVLDLAAGDGAASSPRTRVAISPMVLRFIITSSVDPILAG